MRTENSHARFFMGTTIISAAKQILKNVCTGKNKKDIEKTDLFLYSDNFMRKTFTQ